jgi:hypothetical protein
MSHLMVQVQGSIFEGLCLAGKLASEDENGV